MTMPADGRPADGIIVQIPNGLGVPSLPARDPFRLVRHRHKLWSVPGRQWISPIAFFWGPFEGDLVDAA